MTQVTQGLPRVCFINLADSGVVTAASALVNFPAANVQNANIRKSWRATGSTSHILCDLGSDYAVRAVAAINVPKTTTSMRVRVSTSDFTGVTGDALDSGDIASPVHPATQQFVYVNLTGGTGRYVRIDIDAGINAAEIGRLCIGNVYAFKRGIHHQNHDILWRDHSRSVYSIGGVRFTDIAERQRGIRLVSVGDDYAEIRIGIEEIMRICGTSRDFLLIFDPEADAITRSRDSFWGSMETPPAIGSGRELNVYQFQVIMWQRI